MRIVSFNTAATSAIHGRKGAKLRLGIKDNILQIRPTDRKAGPHILSELVNKGRNSVQIHVTDKELEKLGGADILTNASKFGLVADKYGWFSLVANEQDNELAIEGAEVSVEETAEEA